MIFLLEKWVVARFRDLLDARFLGFYNMGENAEPLQVFDHCKN